MHVPDGFISAPINLAALVISVAAVGYGLSRLRREMGDHPQKAPLLAMSAAFIFAAQMLNFPIGGGASGHFLGAVTAAALMGPWSALIMMTLVLTIQAVFFADGGITAWGTNIFNMGIVGVLGGYLIMRGVRAMLPSGKSSYLTALAAASWISVILTSALCAVELAASGTSPVQIVLPAMLATHGVIGVGEALIACAIISAVMAARPDILYNSRAFKTTNAGSGNNKTKNISALIGAGVILTLALAMFVSPFASSDPDGLEAVAEETGFMARAAHEEQRVWRHSLLPDYAVAGLEYENVSTGIAGFAGTGLVFVIGFLLIKFLQHRANTKLSGD